MKILQILPALNQGGVEHYVLDNCRYIARYADSYVISAGGKLVDQLIQSGSTHITLPIEKKNIHSLLQVKKLHKTIEEIHPNIIHIHSRLQAWLVYFALKKLSYRPKIVTTVHGFNSVNRYSQQMLAADAVIAVSQSLKEYLSQSYPQQPVDKVIVIPQGIDPTHYNRKPINTSDTQEKFTQLGIDHAHDQVIVLPGRITRIKGIPLLIDLMQKLSEDNYDHIKAIVVGGYNPRNAEFYNSMVERIQTLKLEEKILWYGSSDDMPSIYHCADLTLSITSKPESYGRTVLESLACGTPVVGFDYGGVGENLRRYYPEGRVRPNDLYALYENVICELSIPKIEKQLLPIDDTIDTGQHALKQIYDSLL